ncbi:Ribonuclease H-like domain, partial [Trinorchestia longiramus]
MSEDVEDILCNILKREFGLQLYESTLLNNEALLLGYVRFIRNSEVVQELLFVKELETDTCGESIFAEVELFFRGRGIPMENIIASTTDGAPALTGKYKGFLSYLKKAVPGVLKIHCVIYRQHLVAKNLSSGRLCKSLDTVMKAVNKIKCQPLNSRIFKQLCHENGEKFDRLLLHTEVRWLSKGNCLKRFSKLYNTVVEFLQENKFCALSDDLMVCKSNIAYLTDLFDTFNDLNLQLQGSDVNLIEAKSKICSFIDKFILFRNNIGRQNFSQFPYLS